jgi:hypothetical protein
MRNTRGCDVGVLVRWVQGRALPFVDVPHLRHVCMCARALGMRVCIVGSPDATIGYTYDGHWSRTRHERPRIVYDRRLGAYAVDASVRLLAQPLPDKHRVYGILHADASVRDFLPHTVRYAQCADLLHMLHTHGSVYVKPVVGWHGAGIWRIARVRGHFVVTGALCATLHRIQDVHALVYARHPLLIQCALPTAMDDGRCVDVRVLVQKKPCGAWATTFAYARCANDQDAIVSNMHRGAHPLALDDFVRRYRAFDIGQLVALCSRIAHVLDRRCGPLIELGLDYAIAPDGGISLIEANGRPGTCALVQLAPIETIVYAHSAPLRMAHVLLRATRYTTYI